MFKVFRSSAIESNYAVSTNPLFVSDPWTIYPAKHKVSKKNCSVFSFNKKNFESLMVRQGVLGKSNKSVFLEDCYKVLENYITNLSRFKHPNILTVLEPLEDHKSRMLFVTEYVTSDLTNFPKQDLDEIIISKGLLQISNGVKFLHQNAHMVHLNIQPSSIFVNESFDWKLSGFNFVKPDTVSEYYVDKPDSRMPSFLSLNLCFCSPELVMGHTLSYNADLFSLGCLIFYLFNSKTDLDTSTLLKYDGTSLSTYERSVTKMKTAISGQISVPGVQTMFRNIPNNYLDMFVRLISLYESSQDSIDLGNHLTIDELIESKIFNNDLIKILNVIDEFQTMTITEKIVFFRNLKKSINYFPKALLLNKFLPVLTDVLVPYFPDESRSKKTAAVQIGADDETLISLVLDNLLYLSKDLSQLSFNDKVFTNLQKLLKLDLASCKLSMIDHLRLIQDRLGLSTVESGRQSETFAAFLVQLFEQSVVLRPNQQQALLQMQEHALLNLSLFLQFQSYTTITHKLFPLICDIFAKTTSLKVKNLTIKSFILLIGDGSKVNSRTDDKFLDNYLIIDKLLPVIQKTSVKNFKNSQILTNMVSLYHHIFLKMSSTMKSMNLDRNGSSILDIIMEQVFFELWKLSKFVHSKRDLDEVLSIIRSVQEFLVEKSTEAVVKKEANSTALSTVTSNDELNDEDEFGDFDSAATFPSAQPPAVQAPAAFRPQETPRYTQPFPQQKQPELEPSRIVPLKKSNVISLTPKTASSSLGFGATSSQSGNNPIQRLNGNGSLQTAAPMNSLNAMLPSNSTTQQPQVIQPSGIDWSKASPSPTTSSFSPKITPMNSSFKKPVPGAPQGFTGGILQPTKRVSSPTPQLSTLHINQNANATNKPNANDTLFDSLI
ncbi:unnamed protein product [Kuraishia capsulata CBS 1993]|uniref:Protein kinase domain-containing protein n=1 Tax=Kuraishia capsulata CBS 1993 TaxID=1382522 RepID=W6MQT3_9ASCO|nr:uncharacterized protein KUCA_T00004697001 [Kuraishia capsulata CBS 1993]CDK28713.1 unnamed protein product [Kuraishia capsulata CBS 1993]